MLSRHLSTRLRTPSPRRLYHDESFGYRAPRSYQFTDCKSTLPTCLINTDQIPDTSAQLTNRSENAALLRYVDSVRTHGHRAARIDPLDLIHRMEVKALDPHRYGLFDDEKKYNVNGIIWTNPKVETQGENQDEWWTLAEITRHLRSIYVDKIAYEVRDTSSPSILLTCV